MLRHNDRDSDYGNDSNGVSRALEAKLAGLPFKTFRNCVVLWLGSIGYREIRSLDRRHRRGRRRVGGADFIVTTASVFPSRVAVHVRHWRTPIQRRAVDELRGFMLRHNVASGLIVASEEFSQSARLAARSYPGRPITVVGPRRLAESMHGLGQGVLSGGDRSVLDERYFRSLEGLDFANGLPDETRAFKASRQRSLASCPSGPVSGRPRLPLSSTFGRSLLTLAAVLLVLATVLYLTLYVRPS